METIETRLKEAIEKIQSGQKEAGRQALVKLLRLDPHNERAWLWLAYALDTQEERIQTLEHFLKIHPESRSIHQALDTLKRVLPQAEDWPDDGAQIPPAGSSPAAHGEPPPVIPIQDGQETVDHLQEADRNSKAGEVSAVLPSVHKDTAFPAPTEGEQEEEFLLHGSTPAPPPAKPGRFWVILSLLVGICMIGCAGLTFWLWTQGSLEIPGLGRTYPSLPPGSPLPPRVTVRPSAFPNATTTPSPQPVLPPARWLVEKLPKVGASNARELGQLSGWKKPGLLAISPRWDTLAIAGDKTVQVWDVERHVQLFTLDEEAGWISDLLYLPQGGLLASATYRQQVHIWDVSNGEPVRTLEFDLGELSRIDAAVEGAFSKATYLVASPDGQILAGVTFGLATLWDVQTGKTLHTFTLDDTGLETLNLEGPEATFDLVFSPDGSLYAMRAIGKVTTYRSAGGQKMHSLLAPGALEIAFSPDGNKLLEAGNGYVAVWDLDNGEEILRAKGLYNAGYAPNAYAFSTDGRFLALEAEGPAEMVEVQLWNLQDKQKVFGFPVFTKRLYSLDFSPDGKLLAAGGSEGLSRIWDTGQGQELVQFEGYNSLYFSGNGRLLAGLVGEDFSLLGVHNTALPAGLTPTPTPTPTGTTGF